AFGCDGDNNKCKEADAVEFRIKFVLGGVLEGEDNCTRDWHIKIKVGNSSKVSNEIYQTSEYDLALSDLELDEELTDSGENIYIAEIRIPGGDLPGLENMAVFIKGPKHLWTKYGVDNQTTWYGNYSGKINIEPTEVNGFDFSGFPVLAGDVSGKVWGLPDGWVNTQDFAFIKSGMNNGDDVDVEDLEGVDIIGDADGNCVINSRDLSLIKKTLKQQHAQLY
ncbi:MAG: hypothetical protein PHT07_24800, partial [Paludibacter sp.]|nr:hypothetical protein [Paludibacter sp.]